MSTEGSEDTAPSTPANKKPSASASASDRPLPSTPARAKKAGPSAFARRLEDLKRMRLEDVVESLQPYKPALIRFGPPVTLLVILFIIAWSDGRLDPAYLGRLSPWAGWLTAAIAAVTFGALSDFGAQVRAAWDTPARPDPLHTRKAKVQPLSVRVLYSLCAVPLGLLAIDNHAVEQLAAVPDNLARSADECPDEDEKAKKKKAAVKPGCALVMRAFEKGYITDLGNCAPDKKEEEERVCTGRQHDEPYLHYAARLGWEKMTWVANSVSGEERTKALSHFNAQRSQLMSLTLGHRDSLDNRARASHHLFTNLSKPKTLFGRIADAMTSHACMSEVTDLPYLLNSEGGKVKTSDALDHAVQQVLFNPAYGREVALCTEYTVHWEQPADICKRLVKDPEGTLDDAGALDSVQELLDRKVRQERLDKAFAANEPGAEGRIGEPVEAAKPAPVSFQCLMVGSKVNTSARPADSTVLFEGHRLVARQMVVQMPKEVGVRGQIDMMRHVAAVFAPSFTHGRLNGSVEETLDPEQAAQIEQNLSQPSYLLSKLDLLRNANIFEGHQWIDNHPNLLTVYPYQIHMDEFVKGFRAHYVLKGRRL